MPFFDKRDSRRGGCQIDFVIQTRKSVYIIEIERKNEIGEEVEREVAEKIAHLRTPKTKSVKTVLVYDGEQAPGLEEDRFFDFLVPAGTLLGLPGKDSVR